MSRIIPDTDLIDALDNLTMEQIRQMEEYMKSIKNQGGYYEKWGYSPSDILDALHFCRSHRIVVAGQDPPPSDEIIDRRWKARLPVMRTDRERMAKERMERAAKQKAYRDTLK